MSDDYIRRGAALELLNDVDRCGYLDGSDIRSIPAADVVTVVRCKDCKRCDGFPDSNNTMPNERGFCELDASLVKPDDFCSYGLRKDGE